MKTAYLATVIAIIVTTSIASHVLALRTLGPATPKMGSGLRFAGRGWFVQVRHMVDDCIAAMLAHRERQAAFFMLHRFSDRELKDIGLHRGNIGHDPRFFERERQARIGEIAAVSAAMNGRRS